jgi:hypothetical protein
LFLAQIPGAATNTSRTCARPFSNVNATTKAKTTAERRFDMGNRACIVFFDLTRVSPTVYLHWNGSEVPTWLDLLKDRMNGRFSDAAYAAARFIGICHDNIDGNLSIGVSSNHFTLADVRTNNRMQEESPGNAGMVVVDTSNFSWRAYGGYLDDGAGRLP